MKVAISTHDYPNYISGPNIWLDRITSFFQKNGVQTVILFTKGKHSSEYRCITALKEKSVPLHVYEGGDYTEKKIEWILHTLNREKPDIFIPNFDIPSLFASKWLKEAGIPCVGAMRSDDEEYMAKLEMFVRDKNGFTIDALVCVSEYLEDKAKKLAHDTCIKRIPSGTPIPKQTAAPPGDERLKLIYTGRITEKQKRIVETTHGLIDAAVQVSDIDAVLYGAGSEIEKVKEIIKERECEDRVKYGGVLKKEDVQNKLLNSHVFVLLSDYEGLPTALMEAMACGVVPVCLNIKSGVPELIEHERTGLLVENRNEDFVNAVERIKSEAGLWSKLSVGARRKIEEEYSVERSFKKWMNLFEELLEKKQQQKKSIQIPHQMNLPEVHPVLVKAERRWPGYFWHQVRMTKSFLRRIASKTKHAVINRVAV